MVWLKKAVCVSTPLYVRARTVYPMESRAHLLGAVSTYARGCYAQRELCCMDVGPVLYGPMPAIGQVSVRKRRRPSCANYR